MKAQFAPPPFGVPADPSQFEYAMVCPAPRTSDFFLERIAFILCLARDCHRWSGQEFCLLVRKWMVVSLRDLGTGPLFSVVSALL